MNRLRLFAVASATLLSARPVSAQSAPLGYYLGESVFLPDSAHEVMAGGRFSVTITRVARDSIEKRLLEFAERLFPDTSAINQAARQLRGEHRDRIQAMRARGGDTIQTEHESVRRMREKFEAAERMPGDRWWFSTTDAVLMPYAVTGTAVQYYRRRAYERAATANPFTFAKPVPEHRGEFTYKANVERGRDDRNRPTHVITMDLSWQYWCGMMCAAGTRVRRVVTISADGSVTVNGDGPPMVVMS